MYLFAVLIGIVAGSRTFTAPAAASWAARLGRLDLGGTLVWMTSTASCSSGHIFSR